MRERADNLLRAFGIAQGLHLLFVTLGVGVVVAGVIGGMAAAYSALPWWSIALTIAGSFLIAASGTAWVASKLRPASSALSVAIDDGIRLRRRLVEAPPDEPSPEEKAAWETRLDDWMVACTDTVRSVAVHRLGAFQVDMMWASDTSLDQPAWKREWLTKIDVTIDRLSTLRASL